MKAIATKFCTGCQQWLAITEFYRVSATKVTTRCVQCSITAAIMRQAKQRQAAIELLGGVCVHCGFSDPRALQFDHVKGGGNAMYRDGGNFHTVVRAILAGSKEFQLLCANCNWIKRAENNENSGERPNGCIRNVPTEHLARSVGRPRFSKKS